MFLKNKNFRLIFFVYVEGGGGGRGVIWDIFLLYGLNVLMLGKGQNVENHFVESLKKNIESLICLIFKLSTTYGVSTYGVLA